MTTNDEVVKMMYCIRMNEANLIYLITSSIRLTYRYSSHNFSNLHEQRNKQKVE